MTGLFGPMFGAGPDAALPAAGESGSTGTAWLRGMLEFEAALVRAQARAGLIPESAAAAISDRCRVELFDLESIAERARASATPVIPLVHDLTALVDEAATPYVHRGATSQDVLDSAAMLVTARALDDILAELETCARVTAELADQHRNTVLIGRTLLQQAAPTTFGRCCAGWLIGLRDAIDALERIRRDRLAVQFGGPSGTLSALDQHGPPVLGLLAEEMGLAEPTLPWHTDRGRIAEIACALGSTSGALGSIALDVKLHAQTEVGELAEGAAGGSSAMPHKQNPVHSVLISAIATRTPGLVSTLLSIMPQEYQRAAGAWQAEWEPLTELLRLVTGAAAHARDLLTHLTVHSGRMWENVGLTGGLVMAESATGALLNSLGRTEAQRLVTESCRRVVERGTTLRAELLADPTARAVLSEAEIVAATEPAEHLGSAGAFVDRALARQTASNQRGGSS